MASNNIDITEEELDLLSTTSAVKDDTLKRRTAFMDRLKSHVAENSKEKWEDIIKKPETIERVLISYLATFRIRQKGTDELIRPKILYFENILSHLKSGLSAETGFDFTNSHKFGKLFKAVPNLKLKIKNDGRASVKHTPQVPDETMQLIYDLLANVQALLTARIDQNEIQYRYVLEKIPIKYK